MYKLYNALPDYALRRRNKFASTHSRLVEFTALFAAEINAFSSVGTCTKQGVSTIRLLIIYFAPFNLKVSFIFSLNCL